ncbi:hypothetical protein HEQ60_00745 [Haematospirillum sp. H1815]|uniref:hypothetical protein n=1 Tax=Haematospirillum sp. H1815 TaxID=2723108 RepID=UPI00143BA52E|nr:hypothetical protein [Haematospirillum sp. H1815]NKD76304.1 hypothetical protein [Haematospirillum sp. H1815]
MTTPETIRQYLFSTLPFSSEADCIMLGFALFLLSLLVLRHETKSWNALFLPGLLAVTLAAIDIALGKPLIEPIRILFLTCLLPFVLIAVFRLRWVR